MAHAQITHTAATQSQKAGWWGPPERDGEGQAVHEDHPAEGGDPRGGGGGGGEARGGGGEGGGGVGPAAPTWIQLLYSWRKRWTSTPIFLFLAGVVSAGFL